MSQDSMNPTPGTWDKEREIWACVCKDTPWNDKDSASCMYCDAERPELPADPEVEQLAVPVEPVAVQLATDFLEQPSTKVEVSNLVETILRRAEELEELAKRIEQLHGHSSYQCFGQVNQAASNLRYALGHAMKIKKS